MGGSSVPTIRPSRSGELPWLKMITASAPAACALKAFWANGQVPALDQGDVGRAGEVQAIEVVHRSRVGPSQPLVLCPWGRQVDVDRDHVPGDVAEAACVKAPVS